MGFSRETREALARYDYPGNVRELENIIARAVALADKNVIQLRDLPPVFSTGKNGPRGMFKR